MNIIIFFLFCLLVVLFSIDERDASSSGWEGVLCSAIYRCHFCHCYFSHCYFCRCYLCHCYDVILYMYLFVSFCLNCHVIVSSIFHSFLKDFIHDLSSIDSSSNFSEIPYLWIYKYIRLFYTVCLGSISSL